MALHDQSKKKLRIESLSSEAEGIGSDNGLKIFVPGALPGEEAEIQIEDKRKNFANAKLLSILKETPIRTTPPCSLFGLCGGCNLMHVKYEEQLALKRNRVLDALKRIGHLESLSVLPCLPSPNPLHYRNKIQMPVVWEKERKRMGLYRKESHDIIPIKECLIQCAQGEKVMRLIDEKLTISSVRYVLIKNAIRTDEALVLLVSDGRKTNELRTFARELMTACGQIKGVVENINTRQDNVILGKVFRTLAGRPFIFEKILNKKFKISPSAFFQVNPKQAEKLYEKTIELAEIRPEDRVLDAFCGVGTFSLFASDYAKEVIGIESVSQAIEDACENAKINEVKNSMFVCGKAEDLIEKYPTDIVFLNPPRKGCDKKLIDTLLAHPPRRILYVSCDPATLARDLSLLSPLYSPDIIQPFDMFPQTMHVETVVRLNFRTIG